MRLIRLLPGVLSLVGLAASAAAQTSFDRQINAQVEQLRGRASKVTFENGLFRSDRITFDVPSGWNYGGTIPGETADDDTARWTDPENGIVFQAWVRRRGSSPGNVDALLANAIPSKTAQRERQRFRRWSIRSDSVHQFVVGGQRALSAV